MVMNCLLRANTRPKPNEYKKHNVAVVRRWVDALRSNKYTQSQFHLKHESKQDHFTAAGVLCEVSKNVTGGEWNGTKFELNGVMDKWYENVTCFGLPEFVAVKLRIANMKVYYPIKKGSSNSFYELNKYYSFKELADIIETYYLK
jgi:hypothetical protein